MKQSIFSFLKESVKKLDEISRSVNKENCFSKLVEYFQVCREIGRRESAILGADLGELDKVISFFLLNLPYCMLDAEDLQVEEECKYDEFRGCKVENQKYSQSFMAHEDYVPVIFTYRDIPSKESITIHRAGINRTLSYIEKEEKNENVINELRDLVCNHFFPGQKQALQDFSHDQLVFYTRAAIRMKVNNTVS